MTFHSPFKVTGKTVKNCFKLNKSPPIIKSAASNQTIDNDEEYGIRRLLFEERKQKEEALFQLDQLQKSYDDTLIRYAEAKNTIDRLRFNESLNLSSTESENRDIESSLSLSVGSPISRVLTQEQVTRTSCGRKSSLNSVFSTFVGQRKSSPNDIRVRSASMFEDDEVELLEQNSSGAVDVSNLPQRRQQHVIEYLECVSCSCPPSARKSRIIKTERNETSPYHRDVLSNKSQKLVHSVMSKEDTRLRAQCLQEQVQLSLSALENGKFDDSIKIDHLSHLSFQLQDLRNDVQRLETAGVDTESLEEIVSKLDAAINLCDDQEQWESTSASVTDSSSNCSIRGDVSDASYTSIDENQLFVERKLSSTCDGLDEFKSDLNERLVAIKSIVDTVTIKKRNNVDKQRVSRKPKT